MSDESEEIHSGGLLKRYEKLYLPKIAKITIYTLLMVTHN
jgi:hypothetical protein